jgi:hypothetical protein
MSGVLNTIIDKYVSTTATVGAKVNKPVGVASTGVDRAADAIMDASSVALAPLFGRDRAAAFLATTLTISVSAAGFLLAQRIVLGESRSGSDVRVAVMGALIASVLVGGLGVGANAISTEAAALTGRFGWTLTPGSSREPQVDVADKKDDV